MNKTSEYLLLFRGSNWDRGLSPEEIQQVMAQTMTWFDSLFQSGKAKGGQPLDESGRTVTGKKGQSVLDGPFAESKEAIAGYLIVNAESLEEAVKIAQGCPTLLNGSSVEVRPLLDECPKFQKAKQQLALATA